MKEREQVLIEQLTKAIKDYYTTGTSSFSDREFDAMIEELTLLNPNAEILQKREIHTDDWNYKLENLPIKLYSIKKVKTLKDIQNWIDFICKKIGINDSDKGNIELILTPKYDGIKLLNNDGKFFTRYETGEQGYDVTNRIKSSLSNKNDLSVEGELIISKSNFEKYCSGYTSSRNFIPAIFSSKEKLNAQDKVEYIKYSVYGEKEAQMDKEEQIEYCNQYNNIKVPYLKIYYKNLTEQTIINFYFENLSDFEYDGVVIDINQSVLRCELGETQKYLDCCRAYKGDALFDDIKKSKIEKIIWQMSRYGKLTPVANITPVVINEGLVSNVSLYNAAYVLDNGIHNGQSIEITRKGKINPKITRFLSFSDAEYPKICPFCGEKLIWNKSKVDLVCPNEDCIEQRVQKCYYFLKTIGIKDFGLESVRSYVISSNFKLEDFFDETKIFEAQIEGIGDITKYNFNSEINRIKKEGIELEKLQEASGYFPGISSTTLKILNTLNVDMEFYYNDRYYNEIRKEAISLEGIGTITADDYLYGLYDFWKFALKFKKIIPLKDKKEDKLSSNKFIGKNICFTGFRNEQWSKIVEAGGGKMLSNINSTCNLLVVKDINSTSSKLKKAKEMGIEVISIENFQNLI